MSANKYLKTALMMFMCTALHPEHQIFLSDELKTDINTNKNGRSRAKSNIVNEIISKLEIIPYEKNNDYKIKSKENDYVLYYVPKDKPLKRIWQELKLHLYSKNIDDLVKINIKITKDESRCEIQS